MGCGPTGSRISPLPVYKAGAIGMSRNMALHHGHGNIRGNCIAPGHIFASMVGDLSVNCVNYGSKRSHGGTAWDFAWAWVFLASDEARWISGVVLPVDAGLFASAPLAIICFDVCKMKLKHALLLVKKIVHLSVTPIESSEK